MKTKAKPMPSLASDADAALKDWLRTHSAV